LELLNIFGKLIGKKRTEIATKKDSVTIGLDKLTETKKMVSVMQEELTVLSPILVKTQKEVAEMMVVTTKDKASAADTKVKVEVEEAKANVKAAEAKAIADDAQKDLAEAIPALEEAVKCLNDLKKSDIDEAKSLKTPPAGVVLTIKACCIMFDVKPIKKNDPNTPGKKIDDYWKAGLKGLLSDAKVFLNSLFTKLAKQKADLVLQNATSNKQLFDIEFEILYLLSNSKDNILDDTVLIETLAQAKVTGEAVKQKMKEAALIERDIALQSENYRPVAKRASLLYFVIADLGFVDPMYQYSLQWFTQLFVRGISAAPPSNEVTQRVENLNLFFSHSRCTQTSADRCSSGTSFCSHSFSALRFCKARTLSTH
jgi:hypothetical protein